LTLAKAGWLLGWQALLILGHVDGLPLAFDDAIANLRAGLALGGLFVGVKIFAHADIAAGGMAADEAVQQAAVALALIAMAIAGFLVQRLLDARGDGVSVLHVDFRE